MATSYFEEHDVGHDNDRQDEESSDSRMLLGLARRLLESGYFLQVKKQKKPTLVVFISYIGAVSDLLQEDAESLFPDMVPPPTSSKFLSDLEETTVRHSSKFAICSFLLSTTFRS